VSHFEERARPAVQQDDGNGIWILGRFVDEMNGLRSDLSLEMVVSTSSQFYFQFFFNSFDVSPSLTY
jgi:hypothetical protein